MTLAQLRAAVSGIIGTDDTAAGVDEGLVDAFANQAVRDILLRTRVYVADDTTTLTAGVGDYRLPASILKITEISVTSGGTTGRVEVTDPAEIFRLRRADNTSQSGSGLRVALEGADLLRVWPTPAAADTLTLSYVPKPTEMSSGSHDPSSSTYGGIPVEYHEAILWYVLARIADYDDDASSTQGDRYRTLYDAELVKIRHALNIKLGRPGRVRIPGHHGQRWVPRPDQVNA